MGSVPAQFRTKNEGIDPSHPGYQFLFRPNECNRCPGCGRTQWYVGRITAECVFCATALSLAEVRCGESSGGWSHPANGAGTHASERRRHQRKDVGGGTVSLLVDGEPRDFVVHNLSAGGVAVTLSAELLSAATVEAVAASGEIVKAQLRWQTGEAAGLQFARPLLLQVLRDDPAGQV